jgi:hypothetical protein
MLNVIIMHGTTIKIRPIHVCHILIINCIILYYYYNIIIIIYITMNRVLIDCQFSSIPTTHFDQNLKMMDLIICINNLYFLHINGNTNAVSSKICLLSTLHLFCYGFIQG